MLRQATKHTVPITQHLSHRLREGIFIASFAVSLFFLLSLLTYHRTDPGWSHTLLTKHIANLGGQVGAWAADVFLYIFGYFAYIFPFVLAYNAWLLLRDRLLILSNYQTLIIRCIGVALTFAAGCGLMSLQYPIQTIHLPYISGGILGYLVAQDLVIAFSVTGATLLLLGLFLAGITLFTGLSWFAVTELIGRLTLQLLSILQRLLASCIRHVEAFVVKRNAQRGQRITIERTAAPSVKRRQKPTKPKISPKIDSIKPSHRYEKDRQIPLFDLPCEGSLPPLSLLDPVEKSSNKGFSNEKLELMSRTVEQRLLDFGVEVQVVAVHPGPVITRFEMQLAPGIKVSKLNGLVKDLARSLSITSVRIVEVIQGKSVVGLELPNEHREIVRLSEVLASRHYDHARSPLSLALGKDIAGHPVIVDLGKMPHLLVAGTTGSGKSVALNTMLISILYKSTPQDVRLILIDPKMLELSIYEGIPHLLTPVVTDMKDAAQALRWCVYEMERRYRLMSSLGVRNLAGFNNKVREAEKAGEPLLDPFVEVQAGDEPTYLEPLPYIVVVVDELADMMMTVGKKVEQLITRIAQKARAAGIHLILATQRPSVDVLTGLIKSNIPTRMAFQVSSKIDSRTILDQQGAEQLLGYGDMLYLAPGNATPVRVHGAFASDQEVARVTQDWAKRGQPEYLEDVLQMEKGDGSNGNFGVLPGEEQTEENDPLYDQAVYLITKTRRASISSVQRRFKIGYNRAARLIEEMERTGIVTAMESNGTREVLAPPPPEDDS